MYYITIEIPDAGLVPPVADAEHTKDIDQLSVDTPAAYNTH